MPSEFHLFQPIQDAQLFITRAGDIEESVNSQLSSNAGLVSLDNAGGNSTVWRFVPTSSTYINGVFIGSITGENSKAELSVSVETEGATKTYSFSNSEVKTFGFVGINIPEKAQEITITLTTSVNADNIVKCSPPFVCGNDMASLVDVCYQNGRTLNLVDSVSFQNTLEQSFAETQTFFTSKSLTLKSIFEDQAANVHAFVKSNVGRLLLLIERNAKSADDYTLGFLSSAKTTRDEEEENTISISVKSKFSNIDESKEIIWPTNNNTMSF